MRGELLLGMSLAAAGCLSAPGDGPPAAGQDGGGDGGTAPGLQCTAFAEAEAVGPIAGAFDRLDGVLAADLDRDGDRDLLLHGATPLGTSLLAARMPQEGELGFHWSMPVDGTISLAAADLVGADGCAELLVAGPAAATTPFTVLGQQVSGEALFQELTTRTLDLDSTGGLWLVADSRLDVGEPGVAIATASSLHALPSESLLSGEAIPSVSVPALAAVRGISLIDLGAGSELFLAEEGRVRWLEPVAPGGQLQFSPRRVLTVPLDPVSCAAGADLDRDGELDDPFCAGELDMGLVLDGSVDPAEIDPAPGSLAPNCPPYDATAIGRMDSGDLADLVVADSLDCADSDAVNIVVLVNARLASGPALEGAPPVALSVLIDNPAADLALVDADGDHLEEIWLFDTTGAARCVELLGGELALCD